MPRRDAAAARRRCRRREFRAPPAHAPSRIPQKWLREAEVKHGRICMLAALGYTFVDATPIRFADKWVGVSSFKAHDANLGDFLFLLDVSVLLTTPMYIERKGLAC